MSRCTAYFGALVLSSTLCSCSFPMHGVHACIGACVHALCVYMGICVDAVEQTYAVLCVCVCVCVEGSLKEGCMHGGVIVGKTRRGKKKVDTKEDRYTVYKKKKRKRSI